MHLEFADELDFFLGKRLREIMEEKDKNQTQFEESTGISRRTLKRIFEGRPIREDELESICKFLDIKTDRFLCIDSENIVKKINDNIKIESLQTALGLAEQYKKLAIGYSERANSEYYLGRIYLDLKNMDKAMVHIKNSYNLARRSGLLRILEKTCNLFLNFYFDNNMFEELSVFILELFERKTFISLPYQMGKLHHYRGMGEYNLGKESDALRDFEAAIDFYTISNANPLNMARIKTNIAEIEFHNGNYEKAKKLLEESLMIQKKDRLSKYLVTAKDLARSCLALNQNDRAYRIAREHLDLMKDKKLYNKELQEKFTLIIAWTKENISLSSQVMKSTQSPILRFYASEILLQLHIKGGDASQEDLNMAYSVLRSSNCNEINEFVRGVW